MELINRDCLKEILLFFNNEVDIINLSSTCKDLRNRIIYFHEFWKKWILNKYKLDFIGFYDNIKDYEYLNKLKEWK